MGALWVPAGARSSLRPFFGEGVKQKHNSGKTCREHANVRPDLPRKHAASASAVVVVAPKICLYGHGLASEAAAGSWGILKQLGGVTIMSGLVISGGRVVDPASG